MAGFLRDTPIKRKLMLVILLTTGFALLLTASALTTYETVTFRHSLAVDMGVLARIIGSNSTRVLASQDRRTAQQILAALAAERRVTKAAIYDREGNIFARFPTNLPIFRFSNKDRDGGLSLPTGASHALPADPTGPDAAGHDLSPG